MLLFLSVSHAHLKKETVRVQFVSDALKVLPGGINEEGSIMFSCALYKD